MTNILRLVVAWQGLTGKLILARLIFDMRDISCASAPVMEDRREDQAPHFYDKIDFPATTAIAALDG